VTALWIALALIAVLAVIGFPLWMWARRPAAPMPVPVPLPVRGREPATALVLVHGFLGFDRIELLGRRLSYFRGIVPRLEALGVPVHVVRVPAVASVPERAARLAEQIAAIPDRRLVVFAHSMGGLDARWAIQRHGLADRVAALITIGTPHRGAPLAELGSRTSLVRLLAGDRTQRALQWLTPAMLERFNREIADHPEVFYGSVVSTRRRAGSSDGLVPAASQRWGEVMAEIQGDHWAQIGWSLDGDPAGTYEQVLTTLAARGLWRQPVSSGSRAAGAA
jgi:triacylglycerol lipase